MDGSLERFIFCLKRKGYDYIHARIQSILLLLHTFWSLLMSVALPLGKFLKSIFVRPKLMKNGDCIMKMFIISQTKDDKTYSSNCDNK